jgi:hypothetical protein
MLELVGLAIITGLLVFLVFSIIRVVFKTKEKLKTVNETMYDVPYKNSMDDTGNAPPVAVPAREVVKRVPESQPAPLREPVAESEVDPVVPGQTNEELRAPEPLQERVSQRMEEAPNAKDPYEQKDEVALFGSNLRHPEAMMSNASVDRYANLEEEIASGVASEVKRPSVVDEGVFSAEMAQNGGQFMNGIFAFDNTDTGTQFSAY